MSKPAAFALGFALSLFITGCQTMREHPKATAFVAASLALSAGLALHNRNDRDSHDVTTQPVVCNNGSCK